jgi:hypothetical protein
MRHQVLKAEQDGDRDRDRKKQPLLVHHRSVARPMGATGGGAIGTGITGGGTGS